MVYLVHMVIRVNLPLFNDILFVNSNLLSQMNKAELIEAMASDAGLSKADAKKALDAFVTTTTKALKKVPVNMVNIYARTTQCICAWTI